MKKAIRSFSCALALALTAGMFAACGEYKRPDSGNEVTKTDYTINFNLPATTKAEIKVIIPDKETEKKIIDAAIEGFNQKYPLIKVTKNYLTIDSYNTTVQRLSQAGSLAEVIWCNSTNYYYLVSNQIALNLDEFYEQGEAAGQFDYDADFTSDFRKSGTFDGVPYAVPRSIDSAVTFYNKDVLTKAGVDLNPETTVVKNGWTWEDFLSVCKQVRAYYVREGKTNFYPLDANLGWEAVSWPIIKSLGGDMINEEGEFALTEEVAGKVYDFVQDLVENDIIPGAGEKNGTSFESAPTPPSEEPSGGLLFQSTTIDHYETMENLKGKFDIVSFPLINGENASIGYGFAGYALNAAAVKDQTKLDAAAAFVNYLISYDGQQKVAKDGGLTLPSGRTDLSAETPDANWHGTYGSRFNVSAYTYGSEYKVTQDFLGYVNPTFSTKLISAMNTYVNSYCIRESKDRAYTMFKGAVEDVFNSVVQ